MGALVIDQPSVLPGFTERGHAGPYPLLSEAGVREATAAHWRTVDSFAAAAEMATIGSEALESRPWFKSKHAYVPEFRRIATDPAILNRLVPLLGSDILVWGCATTFRAPQQRHRWHVDIEHFHWKGVTVFIGLEGMSPESTLTVVDGSHRVAECAQDHGISTDQEALSYCRSRVPGAALRKLAMGPGEFYVMDGRLWHSSVNLSPRSRLALVVQYCAPDVDVRIPISWNNPVRWHPAKPPCVQARGRSIGLNRIV